jgi:hypothetical protein
VTKQPPNTRLMDIFRGLLTGLCSAVCNLVTLSFFYYTHHQIDNEICPK